MHMYILCVQLRPFCDPNKHLPPSPHPPVALFIHFNTRYYYSPVCDRLGWSLTFCLLFMCILHPRPGCCAGHGPAASLKSSIEFPDDTLQFIKSHPLMDTAVPSIGDEPWFTKTRVRCAKDQTLVYVPPLLAKRLTLHYRLKSSQEIWMLKPRQWVTAAPLLCVKVQTDSAGCGQWSRTSQELHSGVHRGRVWGCPQSFSQDLLCVSEWQRATGGDRRLQQGKVGTRMIFTLSLYLYLLFFSSPSGWVCNSFLGQMAASVYFLCMLSMSLISFCPYLGMRERTPRCVRG